MPWKDPLSAPPPISATPSRRVLMALSAGPGPSVAQPSPKQILIKAFEGGTSGAMAMSIQVRIMNAKSMTVLRSININRW